MALAEVKETSTSKNDIENPLLNEFTQLSKWLSARVVGQPLLVERLLIALLSDGHLLVEGAPGLAKTKAVKDLASAIEGDFHRIQFTPDLLPADLTGTEIYRPQDSSFVFQQGPLFHNVVLADEINRAPAKVQSALLEAMAERQITVGKLTYNLPPLFLVMATQNPIEQEGTYPLPEAQLDRFLMHVKIDYPSIASEHEILTIARQQAAADNMAGDNEPLHVSSHELKNEFHVTAASIFAARKAVMSVYLAPKLEEYIVQLVHASRNPKPYGEDLANWIDYGASPRGTIALDRTAKSRAWLGGKDFVSPGDIQAVAHDVLRHRILLSFAAEADGIDADGLINELIKRVPLP
ncbi:MAG: AAA family ATPase [Arenicellales bacterium WSBS_2016_MAG_OTU3]